MRFSPIKRLKKLCLKFAASEIPVPKPVQLPPKPLRWELQWLKDNWVGKNTSKMVMTQVNQAGNYARPAKRSAVLYHHNYYHLYYLAQALRRRNWDVLNVVVENPSSPSAGYYHGEDINLWTPDSTTTQLNIKQFMDMAKGRFKLFHFSNDGMMSFFPNQWLHDGDLAPDMKEWKAQGGKIAYTVSGCNSGISKRSVANWSKMADNGKNVCSTCVWEDNEEHCSHAMSRAWGKKVSENCDVIFAEVLPALDVMTGRNVVREPVTACLDPIMWHPDMPIPKAYRIDREPSEILLYHAVGNYDERSDTTKNIKGTPAVMAAIDQLKAEGYPVRLVFVTNVSNREVRFTQAQADIVIDQLNFGRYGANARECMMLGKPVVNYINATEPDGEASLKSLQECPIVSADETTIYTLLKSLVDNPIRCQEIGQASREYALKWHSADACAERYETIYDAIVQGKQPTHPDNWNYYNPELLSANQSSRSPVLV